MGDVVNFNEHVKDKAEESQGFTIKEMSTWTAKQWKEMIAVLLEYAEKHSVDPWDLFASYMQMKLSQALENRP